MENINKKNSIILLNKASGITSFSALGFVKRFVNRKTGHTGTLDKFASGLIIALCGCYTKYNDSFMNLDKTYIAEIEFGKETDTLDPEGAAVKVGNLPELSVIQDVVNKYQGSIMQRPPLYSAIHVDGKRSYKIARSGGNVELEPRNVHIYDVEVLSCNLPYVTVKLHVSKGFYVRSYARDLGSLCGSCAYVRNLKRIKIGPFLLDNAIDYNNEEELKNVSGESAEEVLNTLLKYKESR